MQVLTDADFAGEVASGLVLVDFFAEWCGPCQMLGPIFEQLAPEYEGKARFVKVDVDKAPATGQQFGVTSVPTLVLLKDGVEVARMTGFQSADVLKAKLDEALAA